MSRKTDQEGNLQINLDSNQNTDYSQKEGRKGGRDKIQME
jgi:hypothetical protein